MADVNQTCNALGLSSKDSNKSRFSINSNQESVSLSLNRTKIFEHSPSRPSIFIGKGDLRFNCELGNFDISQYVEERVALINHQVEQSQNSPDITFLSLKSSNGDEVKFSITCTADQDCEIALLSLSPEFDWLWIRLVSQEDEKLYGCGEQFTHLNLKGKSFPIWTREQGVGRSRRGDALSALVDVQQPGASGDYHTTYFPQSSFISSRLYYCHVTGNSYKVLDFERDTFTEIFLPVSKTGEKPSLKFGTGSNFEEMQKRSTKSLGLQPKLPSWIHTGTIIGVQGGTQKMLQVLDMLQAGGVKVSALWIQDWCGKIITSFGQRVFWNWEWDRDRYPGLDEVIHKLKAGGVRLLGYINPHVNKEGELFKEAERHNYLMKTLSGSTYLMDFGEFHCGTVDLLKPAAVEWYKGIIKKNLVDLGFSGWMADFGEYIPTDGVFNEQYSGLEVHNQYPVLWAKLNREVIEEVGQLGELIFYTRSGGEGTQCYSLLSWAGDQNVDWSREDGLASTIPAALSLGLSGFGLTHFDIGGFTTIEQRFDSDTVRGAVTLTRSRELLLRSAEMAVFTPVMRTHEGNKPGLNAQIYDDDVTIRHFSRLVDMFTSLSPYTESLIEENSLEGLPLQRPLFLHYPSDPESFDIQSEYLYGRDVLVAPVLNPSVEKWSVHFPGPETWVSFYNKGKNFSGPSTAEVDAPLGKIPVFYRQESKWVETFEKVGKVSGFCDEEP